MKAVSQAIVIILAASILAPTVRANALPAEPDYPCYMRAANGRVIDLTSSLCSSRQIQVAAPTVAAAASTNGSANEDESSFIRHYKQRARLVENPAAAKYLMQQASQIPEKLSNLGSSVCNGVKAELNRPDIVTIIEKELPTDNQNALLHYAGLQRIGILIDMAEAYDCP